MLTLVRGAMDVVPITDFRKLFPLVHSTLLGFYNYSRLLPA